MSLRNVFGIHVNSAELPYKTSHLHANLISYQILAFTATVCLFRIALYIGSGMFAMVIYNYRYSSSYIGYIEPFYLSARESNQLEGNACRPKMKDTHMKRTKVGGLLTANI